MLESDEKSVPRAGVVLNMVVSKRSSKLRVVDAAVPFSRGLRLPISIIIRAIAFHFLDDSCHVLDTEILGEYEVLISWGTYLVKSVFFLFLRSCRHIPY